MPVVCMSPSDRFCLIETTKLADKYHEALINYTSQLHLLKTTQDIRITMLGHGSANSFGDYRLTPEMLTADLISIDLSDSVEVIDLLACEIGEKKGETSFVINFTLALNKYEKYKHIRVNAFSNTITDQTFTLLILNTHFSGTNFNITGISDDQKQSFDQALQQGNADPHVQSIKTKAKHYLDQKKVAEVAIRELKLSNQDANDKDIKITELVTQRLEAAKELQSYMKQYSDLTNNVYNKVHKTLGRKYYVGEDMRRALDFNENFHHTANHLEKLKKLSDPIKRVLSLLYTRIGELKEELFQMENQSKNGLIRLFSFSLFANPLNLKYQISALSKLADIVKNPEKKLGEIHMAFAEALRDSKLDSKENQILAKKIMAIMGLTQVKLEQLWSDTHTLSL